MLLDLLKAAILGVVQGLTEFLPVSSTGHLILFQELLNVDQDQYGLPFDAALHLGTLLSVLWFFGKRWLTLLHAGIITERTRDRYARWVDMEELSREGDQVVAAEVTDASLDELREINRGRSRLRRD